MTPIWILNLTRSTERRQHMTSQLEGLGLAHEFVEAIDGASMSREELIAHAGPRALEVQPWLGRALTPSEIGCALSHALVWERLAAGRVPSALVLEDDVDVGRSVPEVLSALARQTTDRHTPDRQTLDRQRHVPQQRGPGLVLLGHHSNRFPWIPGAPFDHRHGALTTFAGSEIAPGVRVARLVEYAQGAYAYWLTRDTARALARFANPIRMPADSVTGYAPRAGVASYAVTPPVVVPTARFATTMTEPRPCPCRVCARARLAAENGATESLPVEQCLAERRGPSERARALAGRAFLLARRLGLAPGSFWSPSF